MTPRRLVILEPDLDNRSGHPHAFASALPDIARKRAIAYRIYGSSTLAADFAERHGIVPLFRPPTIPAAYQDPIGIALYRMLTSRHDMAAELRGGRGPVVDGDDVVLLPTARHWLMMAVADWLETLPTGRRPLVIATFHEANALFSGVLPGLTYEAAAVRVSTVALTEAAGAHRVLLTATTDMLARRLASLVEMPVAISPVSNPTERYTSPIEADRRRDAQGRPVIALPGVPRADKSPPQHVERVASAIARALPDVSLVVQLRPAVTGWPGLPPDPFPIPLEIHHGPLPDAVYEDMLRRAALVVVPYQRMNYQARVSGIFVDAVAAGCVLVVPSGTWMSAMIDAGRAAGVAFDGDDPPAIAAATQAAVAALPALSAAAAAGAAAWRDSFGVGPYLLSLERALSRMPGARSEASPAAPGAAPGAARRRWILVEPRLGAGHDERRSMLDGLHAIADARGTVLGAWGREDVPAKDGPGAVGLFRVGSLPAWASNWMTAPLARFIQATDDMAVDLGGPRTGPTDASDLLLVPDAEPWTLAALARWLRALPAHARPRVAVTFQAAPPPPADRGPSLPQSMVAVAVRDLADILPAGRLVLSATTAEAAANLATASGWAFSTVPTPLAVDRLHDAAPAGGGAGIGADPRIALLPPGWRTNENLPTPALAAAIRRRLPDAAVIDAGGDGSGTAAAGPLGPEARRTIVAAAAIVVVGAPSPALRHRLPPTFREGAVAGRILVVPSDTAMAAEVAAGRVAGVVAGDGDAAIADAVARAAAARDTLSVRAAECAVAWRAQFGVRPWIAAIERLLDAGAPG